MDLIGAVAFLRQPILYEMLVAIAAAFLGACSTSSHAAGSAIVCHSLDSTDVNEQ